jgi:hypothetical protein
LKSQIPKAAYRQVGKSNIKKLVLHFGIWNFCPWNLPNGFWNLEFVLLEFLQGIYLFTIPSHFPQRNPSRAVNNVPATTAMPRFFASDA